MSRFVREPRLALAVCMLLLGAAIAFPLGVIASHQFTDVPTTNTYHADIDALADAGVTTGCGDGTTFCPSAFVTREQMAAFMNRLGALAAGKTPVVNADKLDGLDSSAFLRSGAIVVHQLGPWETNTPGMSILRGTMETMVQTAASSGTAAFAMNINLPASIAGHAYGLQSVKLCWSAATAPGIVTETYLQEARDNATGSDLVAEVMDRNLQIATCYTLTDPSPTASAGATAVRLAIGWSGAGVVMKLRSATITWVPIA